MGRKTLIGLVLIISSMFFLKFVVIPPLLLNTEEITPTFEIIRTSSNAEAYALLQQLENQTLPTIVNWTYILSNKTLEGYLQTFSNISEECTTPEFAFYWNVSVTRNETVVNFSLLNALWRQFDYRYFDDIYLEDTDLFFWWDNGTKTVIDPYNPYQSNVTLKSHSITWIFCGLVKDTKFCKPMKGYSRMRKQMFLLDHALLPVVFAEGYQTWWS